MIINKLLNLKNKNNHIVQRSFLIKGGFFFYSDPYFRVAKLIFTVTKNLCI
jgi:hypothetical protein